MAQKKQYILKRDRYSKARGGNSHFLNIYCATCGHYVVLYQKDGKGRLLRIYFDRIIEPKKTYSVVGYGKKNSNLTCPKCNAIIGVSMIYQREKRPAFRLFRGSFIKERNNGNYSPLNENL